MDDIERKLFHDLGDEKEIPNKVRTVIEESIKDTKNKEKEIFFYKSYINNMCMFNYSYWNCICRR